MITTTTTTTTTTTRMMTRLQQNSKLIDKNNWRNMSKTLSSSSSSSSFSVRSHPLTVLATATADAACCRGCQGRECWWKCFQSNPNCHYYTKRRREQTHHYYRRGAARTTSCSTNSNPLVILPTPEENETHGNQSNHTSSQDELADGNLESLPKNLSQHPASSSSSSLNDLLAYRASTQRLLQRARGSFAPETYFEVEQILSWWSAQRTVESVKQSLALLLRTSQEEDEENNDQATKIEYQIASSTNHDTHNFVWKSWLTSELLNSILHNWRHVWVHELRKRMQHVLPEETQLPKNLASKDGDVVDHDDFVSRFSPPAIFDMVNQLYESTENGPPRQFLSASIDQESFLEMALAVGSVQTKIMTTTKNPPLDVPRFCEQLLQRCLHLWLNNGVEKCRPSARFFSVVLLALAIQSKQEQASSLYANSNPQSPEETDLSAAQRADAVWQVMRQLQIAPNRNTYLRLVQVHAATQSVAGAQRCQDLLQQMHQEWLDSRTHKPSDHDEDVASNSTHLAPPPHSSVISITIEAWAASGSPQAGEKALEIMRQVKEWRLPDEGTSSSSSDDSGMNSDPYLPAIHAVMKCFAGLQTLKGAQAVEKLFLSIQKHSSRKLSYETFLIIIKSWAQLGHAERAESLLQEMIKLSKEDADLKPARDIWTTVIAALANSKVPDKVERAITMLRQMEDFAYNEEEPDPYLPNEATFNAILNCCAKASSSASQAEIAQGLLKEMKTRKDCRPDAVSYTTVIHLWARAGHPRRAQEVFNQMLAEYMETKYEAVKPDLECFNTVLSAYVRSKQPDAALQALECLRQLDDLQKQGLKELQPDAYSYATVIGALSNSPYNRIEKAQQAEQLLRDMQKAYREGNQRLRPSAVGYNSVMNAWARAGDPGRAEQLLMEMYDDYSISGDPAVQPTALSFNTVLKAWAFANRPDQVEAVFERMKELASLTDGDDGHGSASVAPNIISYTTLLMSYGIAKQPDKAQAVMEDIKQQFANGQLSEGPNRKTYELLQKAWMTSWEPDKQERAAAVQREMMERFGDGRQ